MKLVWQIEEADIQRTRAFYESHKNSADVIRRIEQNVKKARREVSKELFWRTMISCLITTRQQSGPKSLTYKFIHTPLFPLSLSICQTKGRISNFVETTLTASGLWRARRIGEEVEENHKWLQDAGWDIVSDIANELNDNQAREIERNCAQVFMRHLKGFGPKQSRNLLQMLGLTRYEIPIDSKVTRWLNEFGFPIELSSKGLSDPTYYNLVLDGFQQLCKECDIYPCLMEAAIFSGSKKATTQQ